MYVCKPSHTNFPIAKSSRTRSGGLCLWPSCGLWLSWLLLLVVFPWPLSHRLAIRTEKWQTWSWENPSKLAACADPRHTQNRAVTGQFSGKEADRDSVSLVLSPFESTRLFRNETLPRVSGYRFPLLTHLSYPLAKSPGYPLSPMPSVQSKGYF